MSAAVSYAPEKERTVRFSPYRKGMGPTFTLELYDVNCHDSAGRWGVGYRLKMGGETVFECLTAKDAVYGHHSVDGDEAVKNVMGWLTLRPGDTDADYFTGYTEPQKRFAEEHAEALHGEVVARFGED